MKDTSYRIAVYPSPGADLPHLTVLYLPGEGSVTAAPFETAEEAAAYAQELSLKMRSMEDPDADRT